MAQCIASVTRELFPIPVLQLRSIYDQWCIFNGFNAHQNNIKTTPVFKTLEMRMSFALPKEPSFHDNCITHRAIVRHIEREVHVTDIQAIIA